MQNKLLRRQLKKVKITSLDDATPEQLEKLLERVNMSYNNYDRDRELYEYTAELASLEFQDLTRDLRAKVKELEKINHTVKDSIEYASLMQKAILPSHNILNHFCNSHFICWMPKDIVGGDIYLMNTLDENSILIMVIDGAGHGVSGAFLTMLVKAIEEEIISKIKAEILKPSPALILEYFNNSIKAMLQQNQSSQANSGFDGGVLYYNKKTNICKYSGAKTPLYIVHDGVLEVIKSDRKSVGFIRTSNKQKYTEYDIQLKKGTRLYITTDGMPDQEGNDGRRYGLEKFKNFILESKNVPLVEQYHELQEAFKAFKDDCVQSDDITVVGLEFK